MIPPSIVVMMLEGEGMMELDERKRTLEGGMGEAPLPFGGQPKRSRPGEEFFLTVKLPVV